MTKFTIIIPTYNRFGYLKRLLDYYNKYEGGENDFEIIVADSSSDDNKIRNKETIATFPRLKILYLSHYAETINPYYKNADSINYVQNEYCVFCADDDFVTLNGIKQSIDFLQKNPDFAVAHGYYISFHLEDSEEKKQQFCWQQSDSHESIIFADPMMRLSHHLSDYSQSTFYAVHRTELLKTVYKEVLKFEGDLLLFGELLASMLTLIYGKMQCLDVLYVMRTEHIDRYRPLPIQEAIDAGTYNTKYGMFRDFLATHLSKEAQLDIESLRRVLDDAMSTYLKKYYSPPKNKTGYITTKMRHFLDYLNLPDWVDRGLRRLYGELVRPRYIRKKSKDMSPSSTYYEDFDRIRRHVLSCSK